MDIFLNLLLTTITGIYAFLTYRMVKSSDKSTEILSKQFEAINRPYITIEPYARPHTTWLYLKIRNSGKTSANNLKLTLDRDIYQFGESHKNLRDSTAFNKTIDSFLPNQELLFALGQGFLFLGESIDVNKTPPQFKITASYSFGDKHITETHSIDLRPYAQSEAPKDVLVEELERINKTLSGLEETIIKQTTSLEATVIEKRPKS